MGLLESTERIVQLGGESSRAGRVAALRSQFEARTGAFAPEDPWFEERSRAFWTDAVTRGRFGREVEADLDDADRRWLTALERAHRGLFRAEGRVLVDVWSGAEFVPTLVHDDSHAELEAGADQLFDARLVGSEPPTTIALLPGAVFHPPQATAAIAEVLSAARATSLGTHDALDALLRMERALRALPRVKPSYAYRPEALAPTPPATSVRGVQKPLT